MSDDKKPFNNPFGALGNLRDALPQGRLQVQREPKHTSPARAVVRIERSGRRGKEVTVIEHLELPVEQRELWLKELKAAFGCGGSVEGAALVLQGDLRARSGKWLEAHGVKKVTLS